MQLKKEGGKEHHSVLGLFVFFFFNCFYLFLVVSQYCEHTHKRCMCMCVVGESLCNTVQSYYFFHKIL